MAVKYAARSTVWGRATTSAFTTVATIPSVKDVSPGAGAARAMFDQSAYGDDWMDFGAGQQEGDEMTFTIAYDPADATHVLLKTDYDTGTTMYLQALLTVATRKWKITATPTGWRVFPDRNGNLDLIMTVKIINPGVVEAASP
jgi:hypothetical protein